MQHNGAPDGAGKLKVGLDKSKREEPQELPDPPQAAEEADGSDSECCGNA